MSKKTIVLILFCTYNIWVFAQDENKAKPDLSKVKGLKPAAVHFESTPILQTKSGEYVYIESDPLDWKPSFTKVIDVESEKEIHNGRLDSLKDIANKQYEKYYQEQKDKGETLRTVNNNSNARASQTAPTLVKNFDANGSGSYYPFDNTMAIANNGTIVSITNNSVHFYTTGGTLIFSKGLDSFFGTASIGGVCDPKVIYDDANDRFIMEAQTYGQSRINSGDSKVYIMTAKANAMGFWKTITLPGNLKKLDRTASKITWFDYPHMAFSKEDIFITGNLFNTDKTTNTPIVYQIQKSSLYATSTNTNYKAYWNPQANLGIYMVPLKHGNNGGYGPGIYLVSIAIGGDDDESLSYLSMYDVTADLGDNPTIKTYSTTLSGDFFKAAEASQKGTTTKLSTSPWEVFDGFYYNKTMHIVSQSSTNKLSRISSIIYTKVNLTGGLHDNIATTTKVIESAAGNFLCYPNINPSNNFLEDGSVICSFLASGPNIYPSFWAMGIGANNSVSRFTTIRNGTGHYSGGASERWGDYSGSCRRASDGSVWVAGMYCKYGLFVNTFKTRIGELRLPPVNNANRIEQNTDADRFSKIVIDDTNMENANSAIENNTYKDEMITNATVGPNPTTDIFSVYFTLKEEQKIKASIIDVNGKTVKALDARELEKGEHAFTFDRAFLAKGMYYVVLENENNITISKEKVLIE